MPRRNGRKFKNYRQLRSKSSSNRKLRPEQLETRLMLDGGAGSMIGDICYRVNVGGPELADSVAWTEDSEANPSVYLNPIGKNSFTSSTTQTVDLSDLSIPAGTPAELFDTDRYDLANGSEMEWDFPVAPGQYEVRLYFAEAWAGAQFPGGRQFNVEIEGQTELPNYDIFTDVGGYAGVVKTFTVTADSNLDIDFLHQLENPAVRGIEILYAGEVDGLVTASQENVSFGNVIVEGTADRVVTLTNSGPVGGSSVTIDPADAVVTPTGASFTATFEQTAPIVLAPGESTDIALTFAPTVAGPATATLSVLHSGTNSPVEFSLAGQAQEIGGGLTLYRVNAGGVEVAGTPVWGADTGGQPSTYLTNSSTNTGVSNSTSNIDLNHPSVPVGTPEAIFQSERFDLVGNGEMGWAFPVDEGEYSVRLYFSENFQFAQGVGLREFDIEIEGVVVQNNYDVFADVGGYTGVVKTYSVSTADGAIDIRLLHEVQNPTIKAIEIVGEEPSELVTSDESLDFSGVVVGQSSTQQITLTNSNAVGGDDITFDPASAIVVPAGSDFTVAFSQSTPITLTPGESTLVDVTFTPTSVASASGEVQIDHSGVGSPLTIDLLGQGVALTNVLYRVNAGGDEIAANPTWTADTLAMPSPNLTGTSTNSGVFVVNNPIDTSHPSIPTGTPMELFQTERFDRVGNGDMTWSFDVTPGDLFEVRLYFAETFDEVDSPGIRIFDVEIDGTVVLDDYDVFAEVGANAGIVEVFSVTSLTSTIEITFRNEQQNPAIKGIEIVGAPVGTLSTSAPALSFVDVVAGQTSSQVITLTNAEPMGGSDITLDPAAAAITPDTAFTASFEQASPIILAPGETTDITVNFAPVTGGLFAGALQLFHSGINSPIVVDLSGEARFGAAGEVFYRVNAGGLTITDTPNWESDTGFAPSPYLTNTSTNSGVVTTSETIDLTHPSVPVGTPEIIFQAERFDLAEGGEMTWEFPVVNGDYEVRLYLSENFSGTQGVGLRQFDVDIEGVTVLDDYDTFAEVGGYTGIVKTFIVNITDGVIDIDFLHELENPSIKAFEIVGEPVRLLESSTSALDFGSQEVNTTTDLEIVFTNNDLVDVTIDPADVSITPGGTSFSFAFQQATPIVLAPGETTTLTVSYAPTSDVFEAATLSVVHSGDNSPIDIALSGSAFVPGAINFTKSTLTTLSGISSPTSLQFGPDGRLYVSEQGGVIHILTIQRNSANDYVVTDQDVLFDVANILNHDDQGNPDPGQLNRLVTGLLVTGTATNPVMYVSNSDPRIGAGPSGDDLNLDTNSGTISRLTWNGSSWDKLDLVRGLPRSEENHGPNGMQLDEVNNILYLAIGGNTNSGAPSNNFAFLAEYALSAAVLSIDLNAIGETTYDLPTLDDEDRPGVDTNDPFGGNDGKNQAIIVPGGPVQVYAPGFRNPYDLVITEAGYMFTVDNGPNAGWGAPPINEGPEGNATNDISEPGLTHGDGLHLITGPGYYGGHPNPTRSNPANTFNPTNPQSPISVANPIESDFQAPGVDDGSLHVFGSSTNGLVEYTSSNFGGALQGDLLTATFSNTIDRIVLNETGDGIESVETLFSSVGIVPLDVTAPTGVYGGSIWVADVGNNSIVIFEPSDGTGTPNDLDGDGYTNDDEIANGTDPENGADVPPDNDLDFTSDLLDDDDDNDTILDVSDAFAIDENNGTTTPVGTLYTWENDSPPAGGMLNLGFTGLMSNGATDYLDQFDLATLTAGGAAGVLTIDSATSGTAVGAANTQQQAFQFGVNVGGELLPYAAHTRIVGPFSGQTPTAGQEMGFYIGTGDQDNFVKIVVTGENGGSIDVVKEVDGVVTDDVTTLLPFAVPGPAVMDFWLSIDPSTNMLQASYSVDQGTRTDVGPALAIPPSWISSVLATGVLAVDPSDSGTMPVTWDFLGIEQEPLPMTNGEAYVKIDFPSTFGTGAFTITNNSPAGVNITSYTLDLSTAFLPDAVFDPLGTAGDLGGKVFTPDLGETEVGLVSHQFLVPHAGGYDKLQIFFDDFEPGETFEFSVDTDPTSVQGAQPPGPEDSASVSGLELTGSTATIQFSDGGTATGQTFRVPFNDFGSEAIVNSAVPAAPVLSTVALNTPAVVTNPTQTIRVQGTPGDEVRLMVVEGALHLTGVPNGGFDIESFEINKAIAHLEVMATIGPGGTVDVPVTLTKTHPEGGINYIFAAVEGMAGQTSYLSNVEVIEYDDAPPPTPPAFRVNAGGPLLAGDPAWNSDGPGGISPYTNAAAASSYDLSNSATIDMSSPTLPAETPEAIFGSERWDSSSGDEMQWNFPVTAGDYEVRLYFAETFEFAQSDGARVFDVAIEGVLVLDDFDIFAIAGANAGHMESFIVTSDTSLDIDFTRVTQNPLINGIEVIPVSMGGGSLVAASSVVASENPAGLSSLTGTLDFLASPQSQLSAASEEAAYVTTPESALLPATALARDEAVQELFEIASDSEDDAADSDSQAAVGEDSRVAAFAEEW